MNTASPVLAVSTAASSANNGARSRSPGVKFRETAMKPETASATSMTRAHHHKDDAAAVRPSTRRGTIISRQPDWWWPRCSLDDEAQPHPAQDHRQGARRDGPDHHPGVADEGMQVGQLGRGSGEDVAP